MATEYRFKNANGVEVTTKSASVANDYRLDPRFTEVKDKPKSTSQKKD